MQRLAGETVALEEKLLQARSAELRAKREVDSAQGHQARLHQQLTSSREEARDLSSTLSAMQVCCIVGCGGMACGGLWLLWWCAAGCVGPDLLQLGLLGGNTGLLCASEGPRKGCPAGFGAAQGAVSAEWSLHTWSLP